MNEDLIKQNRYLKIYAVVLTLLTVLSAYFSFICYSQINLFYSYIENMDKRFLDSSKKINNLIDESIKINQKVTDINEKTDKKIIETLKRVSRFNTLTHVNFIAVNEGNDFFTAFRTFLIVTVKHRKKGVSCKKKL